MNSWSKAIAFPKPLRDVRLAGAGAPLEVSFDTELQASYERGRIEGERALGEQLLRQRGELHELMQGLLTSLRQAVPQVVRDTESTLVALALSVAQKIVAEMPISVSMVEAAIRDALTQVEGTSEFTVRLHPADLELLQKSESPLLSSNEDGREFRFLTSPEVSRGGCLVQTHFGIVDARRETKFDLLQRALVA
jgi:flagellar assembly protein FliH